MIGAVLTIARRDFLATVFTRGFLVWLLMPLIGLAIGLVAAMLSTGNARAPRAIAVVTAGGDLQPWLEKSVEAAKTRATYAGLRDRHRAMHAGKPLPPELTPLPEDLSTAKVAELARPGALEALRDRTDLDLGGLGAPLPMRWQPPALVFVPTSGDPVAQAERLMRRGRDADASRRFDAVLRLDARAEHLLLAPGADPDVDAVARLVNDAREARALAARGLEGGLATAREVRQPLAVEAAPAAPVHGDRDSRAAIGQAGTVIIFMLIGLLAGVLLSNMVEEKSSKVIEVLVASVPVPAIFAGKLLAMLAVSAIGVLLWGSIAGMGAAWIVTQVPAALIPTPAVGWPAYLLLCVCYLVTAYLLYGAIYLGIGALCSSIREVQSLSMPVTIVQMVVLIGVLTGADNLDGGWATVMAWVPPSSPYMMATRAAIEPGLAIHALAILWQLLAAAAVIWWSARLFRSGVLNSGPAPTPLELWRRQKSSLS